MSTETQRKSGTPQIVRLDKALKLAEQWVNNMSKGLEDETEIKPEGRPSRLGLGAKVVRQSKVGPLNDPVERKLHAKLEAGKRKAAKINEGRNSNDNDDDNDSDEELESRTSAFAKKKGGPPTPSLQVKKKQK